MVRLKDDLVDLLYAAATGTLSKYEGGLNWTDEPALCVVMAAKGYPGSYSQNTLIQGLETAAQTSQIQIFHAGTARNEDGDIISIGGRVLNIVAIGSSIEDAQTTAYKAIDKIDWPEGFCRRDIGWRAVKAQKSKAA